jgi:hypothetical protein
VAKDYFPKVKEARELLKEKAREILEMQQTIIEKALAAEKFDVAAAANQFLIEHMPDEEGVRMISATVNKQLETKGPTGPTIQIGFNLGTHRLPEAATVATLSPAPLEILDVTDEQPDPSSSN